MKKAQKRVGKAQHSKLLKRLTANRKRTNLIATLAIVLLLGVSTLAYIKLGDESNQSTLAPNPGTDTTVKILRVDSSIAGVSMIGTPYCGSQVLNKQTPYSCELMDGQNETLIIAPKETIIASKSYTFKTWDGCSESNPEKNICKVAFSNKNPKSITAQYEIHATKTPTLNPAAPRTATSPCLNTSSTTTTHSCTVRADSLLVIRGFPAQQNSAYTSTLADKIDIRCSVANSCSSKGTSFTEKYFGHDAFTPPNESYVSGAFSIDINQPTNIVISVPKSLTTSYKEPFCKGCPSVETNHTFNHWDVSSKQGRVEVTTYFVSKQI